MSDWHIEGDKMAPDWLADYLRIAEAGKPQQSFDDRFDSEVFRPAINLLMKFANDLEPKVGAGDVMTLATPPMAYKLRHETVYDDDEDLEGKEVGVGTVWLEGTFATQEEIGSLVVPNPELSIWAAPASALVQPNWILKAVDSHIVRNTLGGEVASFGHGDINRFKCLVDDIGEAAFGAENKRLMRERQAEQARIMQEQRERREQEQETS